MIIAMCDYCDCRSQPEIAALSQDHERILSLVGALRRWHTGGDEPDVDAVLDELELLLATHTQREEAGVFARLRAVGIDDEYLDRFGGDHVAIEVAIDRARADHACVPALVDLLARHIHDEETDMFPAAHQVLAPADWDHIAHVA